MDNYHILERIGEGSFGKVYRGRRKYSGHIVALKFVTKQGKSARELHNLRQEIQILQQLEHCNIIAIMDFFETDREFCIVTEYAQGDLFQILEDEQKLPELVIQKITIQLLQALSVLHANCIIHRDLKPPNILIGSKEQIKVCDFGFARAMPDDSSILKSIKGVILYELAVGRPPFDTDKIVALMQMIICEDIKYPATMSMNFQSFLKGLLKKDPSERLTWPEIFKHPFVQETPDQVETRLQLERQVRALPRFFQDKEKCEKEEEEVEEEKEEEEETVKPIIERLHLCDEWNRCDPEIGKHLPTPELSEQDDITFDQVLSTNQSSSHSPFVSLETNKSAAHFETFLGVWDRSSKEMDVKNVDAELMATPWFTNAVSLLPAIPYQELTNDTTIKIGSLLHLLNRSLVLVLNNIDSIVDFSGLLEINNNLHRFLTHLVDASEEMIANKEQVSDVIYKSVRCCMTCTTIVNEADIVVEEKHFDYREFCNADVALVSQMLYKTNTVVATSHSKALKWLGSMIDGSQSLVVLLEVIHASGTIQILCEILHASGISRVSGGSSMLNDGQELGLYALFALAAFVQPDAKCWGPLQLFPVMSLIRDDSVPMKSSGLQDVKHLYKLCVKIHTEVGSQLLNSGGISNLISLLGDEIAERGSYDGDTDVEEDDDANQSTISCILKILVHACRASSSLSKKLTITKVVLQNRGDSDILTILLWGTTSAGLHKNEQYFATELLSVFLRRGILSKPQIWRCAQTLFPLLLNVTHTALLSALSSFFAEVIEICNIDESVLGSDGNPDGLDPQSMELWNLVVHGALTQRCSDAIFHLFSNSATGGEVESIRKPQVLTNYNLRSQGLLDSGIVFLLRVASKALSQAPSRSQNEEEGVTMSVKITMFLDVFMHDRVWKVFEDMMASGGGDQLSPWGLFCFLKLLRIVQEIQCDVTQIKVAHLLQHLVNALELKHIEHLFYWPEVVGGGSNAVKALVHAIVKVLGIPFMRNVSEELLVNTQEILYNSKCVEKLLGVLCYVLSTRELQLETSVLELPVSFLSRLVTSSSHFGLQFVEADGMLIIKECIALCSNCSPSLLIDLLMIVSQLARSSETYYTCILTANLLPQIYELLQHPDAMVRAKTLNCIGNLCRHSTLFYHHLITPLDEHSATDTVLDGMIRALSDSENYVRRFACSAIGNAAFHSSELYNALRRAIPLLVQNLHDGTEKTRSNAAGALGNFVRNSEELYKDLCASQVPWKLLELAMTEMNTATRRIVIFSLGNFCAYPECLNMLIDTEPNFIDTLQCLYDKVLVDEVSRRNICCIFSAIEALDLLETE
ncbi:unnamed protein product [Peronospora belbahrii]|uniref:non-specific serine/threonine protein kinase n=1 Tax=Peronospora belbahrii TaxID=622444 RepID=A0AAU9KWJ4_9STRA|nr:unnamed protein product [Peronospora belbahrii]CAH0520302.1 unnamed protein product [Peronospora belbahrii]